VRTTLTLDDDLARALRDRARERDLPFKQVVNDAIRAGLNARLETPKPYRMKPGNLHIRPGIDVTRIGKLLDEMDVEEFIRKRDEGR
jgi:hypothetical protein